MDSLCFKPGGGAHGISAPEVAVLGGIDARHRPAQVSALGRASGSSGISIEGSARLPSSLGSSFMAPFRTLWPAGRRGNEGAMPEDLAVSAVAEAMEEEEEVEEEEMDVPRRSKTRRGSWVLKILHITSIWLDRGRRSKEEEEAAMATVSDQNHQQPYCSGCNVEDEESDVCRPDAAEFDRESFSRLLRRVSLVEAKVYAQMSYLGNLAYSIPKIKPGNLLKHQGLHFVTSSLKKKEKLAAEEKEPMPSLEKEKKKEEKEHSPPRASENLCASSELQNKQSTSLNDIEGKKTEDDAEWKGNGYQMSASAAYQIAAAAASYLQSHTRGILSFRSKSDRSKDDSLEGGNQGIVGNSEIAGSEVASFVATTNSVTAVVAGKEEMKQAVANDLRSASSSPCEWFICDDESCGTRFFVIQGSESLASWQANLLFEPIRFEESDVLVHRGIYAAAKGIYEQILPEVREHLKLRGKSATLRFTGHSLGGSLSLLLNLMLLIRGEAPISSLLPVIMFGSPSVMCGGNKLLRQLGLPPNHVQAIIMHRDIVPRAFSCVYPDHVAELLRALNGNFRNHPCLKNQKLLFAPMGKLLILQPEEKFSPQHPLLPSGTGLYLLGHPVSGLDLVEQLGAAQTTFLNSPHPLEILSDPSAYGSDGAICRDHDMNSYMRSIRAVIRLELKHIRKLKREKRRKVWWPVVASPATIVGHSAEMASLGLRRLTFPGMFHSGRVSLKGLGRLVASQHVHFLVVLLFPARMLLLGTLAVFGIR